MSHGQCKILTSAVVAHEWFAALAAGSGMPRRIQADWCTATVHGNGARQRCTAALPCTLHTQSKPSRPAHGHGAIAPKHSLKPTPPLAQSAWPRSGTRRCPGDGAPLLWTENIITLWPEWARSCTYSGTKNPGRDVTQQPNVYTANETADANMYSQDISEPRQRCSQSAGCCHCNHLRRRKHDDHFRFDF